MPSLRCLVSTLTQTQAGGGDLLFRFASSVQPCCGEGGELQAAVAVCGEHWPCSGQAARGLALSPRARRALPVGSQEVFRQEPGPVCRVGEATPASLGLSLPLSPPPASYLQRGWAGSSLEFLSPVDLRTASGVFRPVNSSLALPQFKKSPSDCSQGLLAGPYSKQCRRILSVPPSCWWRVRASGVLFCWELLLARNLWALFNFSSQLGCPPRSENFSQTRQREGFLVVGNFLY